MKTLVKTNGSKNWFPTTGFFDDFISQDLFNWPTKWTRPADALPAVNIHETDTNYQLEVAVPGMKKNDFKIELDNDQLNISAERTHEEEEKDKNYTRREFGYYNFSRSFRLPEKMVQGDKISAKYEEGILNIVIPKTEEAKVKPAKQILIS